MLPSNTPDIPPLSGFQGTWGQELSPWRRRSVLLTLYLAFPFSNEEAGQGSSNSPKITQLLCDRLSHLHTSAERNKTVACLNSVPVPPCPH